MNPPKNFCAAAGFYEGERFLLAVVSEVVSDTDNWQQRSGAFIEDNEYTGIQPEYGDFDFYRRRNYV